MTSKEESLTLQKISDLVERVNYLEEQNLKSRKALDTALLQNKHLEKCIENLETKFTENEKRARMTDTFKQDILELLDTIQNFEVRVSLLETKYMDLELDMRSQKTVGETSAKKQGAVDMKVDTLLTLVKQYDASREKQAVKLSKRLECCEGKIESFTKQTPACDPPEPASVAMLSGNPLQYQIPGMTYHMIPPSVVAPVPMTPLTPHHLYPLPPDSRESFSLEIDASQYGSLVGTGGQMIDSVRERSGASIIIKEKRDKPPRMYYEVQITGSCHQVKMAKSLVQNNVAQYHSGQDTEKDSVE